MFSSKYPNQTFSGLFHAVDEDCFFRLLNTMTLAEKSMLTDIGRRIGG